MNSFNQTVTMVSAGNEKAVLKERSKYNVNKKSKRVRTFLVTGASGFLGYHVCKYLVEKNQRVVGVDIADFNYPKLRDKIKFYKGDIRDRRLMERIMRGVDVVIHSAAALPLWKRDQIFSVNVYGTKLILELALKLGVERVVYISSTAVYGIPRKHPVTEESKLVGVGPYGESKIKAEHICLEYRKKGLCVPILRPKTFVGEERLGVFSIYFEWVREGHNIPIIGNGKNKYQLLDVSDLVEAIWLVSTKPKKLSNDTFNVGASEFTTMKEDFGAVLKYAGFGKHIVTTPAWLVIPILRLLNMLKLSPLYPWVYETAAIDHYVDVSKIQKKLGWKPKKSTAQALIDSYKWYEQHWKEYKNKIGVTHRTAWKEGILSFVKLFF